jgi:hypothetical protein
VAFSVSTCFTVVKLLWEIMGWQALGTTKRILLSLQMVDGDGTGTGKLTPVGLIVVCSKPPYRSLDVLLWYLRWNGRFVNP